MASDFSIDVFLEGEDPTAILNNLQDAGAGQIKQVKEKAFTGLEIALFAIIGTQALANLVIRLSSLAKAGVFVDARGSKVTIRKDRVLPRGSIIILTNDGQKSTFHGPKEVTIANLLQNLQKDPSA